MAQKRLSQCKSQHAGNLPFFVPFHERSSSLLPLDEEDAFCLSRFGECVVPGLVCYVVGEKTIVRIILKIGKKEKKKPNHYDIYFFSVLCQQ